MIWACIGDSLLCAVELERSGSGVDRRDDACKLLKLWATEAALALVQAGRGAFLLVGRERQVSLWLLLTWRFVQQAPPTCSFHDLGMSKQNLLQLFNTTPHQSAWLTQCRPVACLASACRTEAAVPQSSCDPLWIASPLLQQRAVPHTGLFVHTNNECPRLEAATRWFIKRSRRSQ